MSGLPLDLRQQPPDLVSGGIEEGEPDRTSRIIARSGVRLMTVQGVENRGDPL
jgi:hypothetical protein